jgi:hypothetical protein
LVQDVKLSDYIHRGDRVLYNDAKN